MYDHFDNPSDAKPIDYGSVEAPLNPTPSAKPAAAPSGYTSLGDLRSPDGKRPLVRFLAAGMLVASVVLLVFFVASGALGRWFGVDTCEGGPTECDLKTVVNSFCPDPIECIITEDCPAGKQCLDSKTHELGIECEAGECYCKLNACGVSSDGTVVTLGGINIGVSGGVKLAKPLKWDTKATKVQLWETEIGDVGGSAIAKAMANHGSIVQMNLAGNGLTDASCADLGKAIAENTKIVKLDLSDNAIGNDGAEKLAEGLKQNNSMRIFSLWKNQIGEQGALYMARAFKYNLGLRKLFLTDNRIDNGGVGSRELTIASDSRDNLEITFEAND